MVLSCGNIRLIKAVVRRIEGMNDPIFRGRTVEED
jgi:hypothetical protein